MSRIPRTNSSRNGSLFGVPARMYPTRGVLPDCCARAASGHAAAPPSNVMNWRRLRSSMGSSPEPAVPAYRRLRMPRKHPQVLGVDLNRSESRRSRLPLPGWSEARLDFADVGGFAADEEVVARRGEEIDHLCVFAEPPFVLRAPWNDHDVAWTADPLFAAEAEVHLPFEHPYDLLICVTVRLDMDASPDAPPYDHSLVAGENAAADFVADPLLG